MFASLRDKILSIAMNKKIYYFTTIIYILTTSCKPDLCGQETITGTNLTFWPFKMRKRVLRSHTPQNKLRNERCINSVNGKDLADPSSLILCGGKQFPSIALRRLFGFDSKWKYPCIYFIYDLVLMNNITKNKQGIPNIFRKCKIFLISWLEKMVCTEILLSLYRHFSLKWSRDSFHYVLSSLIHTCHYSQKNLTLAHIFKYYL